MKINHWNISKTRGFLIILSLNLLLLFHQSGFAQEASQVLVPQSNLPDDQQYLPYKSYLPSVLYMCDCYFIDSINGSDSNSGTRPEKPWKNLSKITSSILKPGTNVYLKRGSSWTEKLRLDASGQDGKPITITAYGSGNPPLLSNPGDTDNNERILYLSGSYIIIEDLHIQDSGRGIYIISNHNVIRNNEINNVGSGIEVSGQYNLIIGNYIHDTRMIVSTPGGSDDWGANGIDISNAHNEISYNKFLNCEALSSDFSWGGGAIELFRNGDYTSIHHNWSYQSAGFMEVSSDVPGSATNVSIYYNTIINATMFTVIHVEDVQIRDFRVENNTLVDLRAHNPGYGSYIAFIGTPSPDTYIFRNNIVYLSDYYRVSSWLFTHKNNLYYFLKTYTVLGFTPDPSELVKVDPKFVNVASSDFHLQSTSPAINAGINLGFSQDFDQNPVPIGNLPDLGAFEYTGK